MSRERWAVAPVQLGCCPDAPRCVLCNPPPRRPDPDYVAALVDYTRHRAGPQERIVVGFFGGAPPDSELIEAADGLPFVARVRPDLLSKADADRLVSLGGIGIELDALTFSDVALRHAGRRYRSRLVLQQAEGLRERGLRTGVVLAPGLPGADFHTALSDAEIAVGHFDTVRLHPVQVFEEARLREAHRDGRYRPLGLAETVSICRKMMDILEPGGVRVIRVGQQAGPDELGRTVSGPRHPALRELVESMRALEALRSLMEDIPNGARVAIHCAPADEGRVRGPLNQHVRTLRADHGLSEVEIRPDPALPRGRYKVEVA